MSGQGIDTTMAGLSSTFESRRKVTTPRPFALTKFTSGGVRKVYGVDPGHAGRIFASNRSYGPYEQSDDYGATWSQKGSGPAGTTNTSCQKFVVFGSHVYVLATATATSVVGVYRATNGTAASGNFSWSSVLEELPAGVEGKSTILNAGSSYIFLAEYESTGTALAALGGPRLRRSADGVTWETAWGREPTVKHIHCVAEDPYNPGHVYMTVGDGDTTASVLRSTNHGAAGSWSTIISAADNAWQSVQISFSPDWVWLASDRIGRTVAVFDRDDLTPYSAALNDPYQMAVPGAEAVTDRFFQMGYLGAVDPDTGIYYHCQSDTSTSGNTFGIFYLPQVGGRLELIDSGKTSYHSVGEVFVADGYVYCGNLRIAAIQV